MCVCVCAHARARLCADTQCISWVQQQHASNHIDATPTWNRYLMKIRLLLVVSSSVSRITPSTPHEIASDASRCENSLATLRSLFVSRR
jgi:hypothetical protein